MDLLDKNLRILEECIKNSHYVEVETDRFELKSLQGGWGEDIYKTICAFLNTDGGIVVVGINDKNSTKPAKYEFSSYINTPQNESFLKDKLPNSFCDAGGLKLNLTNNISKLQIKDFLDGKVLAIYVEGLADDEKYAFYKGTVYVRKLTGDHKLCKSDLEEYEELKRELITNKELSIVKNATLENLNIDTLNQYILKYNKGKSKGETIKADLNSALSFLDRQGFVRDGKPTLLGMLICGSDVENYIQGKCEADCYVISPHKVAQNREVINDNLSGLIERSSSFVWRNIQVGIGYAKGGTAEPEYPEELIRESINNAFAHRNYNTDRFVIIEIRPQESLMIRNPGGFERRQRIVLDTDCCKVRRIVPIQVARNPKLTHLLKSFDYWEGKGRGLTSLIDACLENQIDVPYYILTDGEIKLFIPRGKVYDDTMAIWIDSFSGYIQKKIKRVLSDDEKIMLSFFYKSELLNRLEQYTILLTMDNNHKEVIATLEENALIFKNLESKDIYPIYHVDRVLMKKEFSEELKAIFGEDEWDSLSAEYKQLLSAIYRHNEFSSRINSVSANTIGTFVYLDTNGQIDNPKEFENYKRKIRILFNKLEEKKYIIRKDGKSKKDGGKADFMINTEYKKLATLFNS